MISFINYIERCIDQSRTEFTINYMPVFADGGDTIALVRTIQNSKIVDTLDSSFTEIVSKVEECHFSIIYKRECCKIIKQYVFGIDSGNLLKVDYEICPKCGATMSIDSESSELQCLNCSRIKELVGLVFEDTQFYGQEGQKSKSSTFNPNRHFQFWWLHILARESEEELGNRSDPENLYGEKLLAKIKMEAMRCNKIIGLLNVDDVRMILKLSSIRRSDLNKNISLILKKITGVGPPQPDETFSKQVESKFSLAIETGETIKRIGRVNRDYYPYYIYKIVESLVSPSHEMYGILKYIYLQSDETIKNDDMDWQKLCSHIGITYKATTRLRGK
jgi:hypothetical protein